MQAVFIYALKDPTTGLIRYIGKTVNPAKRFTAHLTEARQNKEHNYRIHWLRSLLENGLHPEFEMLAQVPDAEWKKWEVEYIAAFRLLGFDLVNGSEGGEGFGAGENHPNFGKPGLRLGKIPWNKGLPQTSQTRAKISAAKLGKKRSLESRINQGAALKGRPSSMLGKKHSPETRAKMSAAHSKNPNSGNFKVGHVTWNKGMKNGKRIN